MCLYSHACVCVCLTSSVQHLLVLWSQYRTVSTANGGTILYLCLVLPFVFKADSSHLSLLLPQLPLKATHTHAHVHLHTHTHTHTHICAWTHTCKTNKTDRLWSLKKLLKMSASNFYSTHSHTHTHMCTLFLLHTDYILSEQICILILMLLVVYVSDCEVWPTCSVHFVAIKGNPHPAISSADGYRFSNCYKIIELFDMNIEYTLGISGARWVFINNK